MFTRLRPFHPRRRLHPLHRIRACFIGYTRYIGYVHYIDSILYVVGYISYTRHARVICLNREMLTAPQSVVA